MRLEGSCYCGQVRFAVESRAPYPYRRCYCRRCRKTAGSGGYAIAIMGEAATLAVEGGEGLTCYASLNGDGTTMETYFCRRCGSHLYNLLPDWSRWVYPYAGAIDTPLPQTPETFHIILDEVTAWVAVPHGSDDRHFGQNTPESIEAWHRRLGLQPER